MNKVAIVLAVFYSLSSNAQDLRNTKWIKIDARRKDGSKIIDRSSLMNYALEYAFYEKKILIVLGGKSSFERNYFLIGKNLSIENSMSYNVDTLSNERLVLTEIPNETKSDDKINTLIFIRKEAYVKYLLQINKIKFLTKSLVKCNHSFTPVYKRENIDHVFNKDFGNHTTNRTLSGNFIVSNDGIIKSINTSTNDKFSKSEIEKFKDALSQTNGFWELPTGLDSPNFKVDFEFRLSYRIIDNRSVSSVGLALHPNDPENEKIPELSMSAKKDSDLHFNKGVKFSLKGKTDKAILEFQKAIEIDSLYVDAYYNKAYCHFSLGEKRQACEAWLKLKLLGQKLGEVLYNENCN